MEIRTIQTAYRNPFRLIKSSPGIFFYKHGVYPYNKTIYHSLIRVTCRLLLLAAKKFNIAGHGMMEIAYKNQSTKKTLRFDSRNSQYHSIYMPYNQSGYELVTTMLLDYFIQQNPALTFFDIGANWGHMSLFVLSNPNFSGKVVAFEPYPPSYHDLTLISQLTETNKFFPYNIALSDKEEHVEFHHPDTIHSGIISVSSSNHADTDHYNAISLDSFCKKNNVKPNLLKIDVEGFELNVLQGAVDILKEKQPFIIIENNSSDANCAAVLSFLEKNGYAIYYPRLVETAANNLIEQGEYSTKAFSKEELCLTRLNAQNRNQFQEHLNLVCLPNNF